MPHATSDSLALEGPAVDAEDLGGGALVAAGQAHHSRDVPPLDGLEVEWIDGLFAGAAEQTADQVCIDRLVRQRYRALDQVLQLSDVAGIVIG